jgi:asparagine synthase (glutamine-hydrolysing)
MSGGLDSPAIAATARKILVERGEPFDIQAYTCVYDRLIPDRERHFSGLAAQALDIPINYLALDDFPLFELPIRNDVREPEPSFLYPRSTAGTDFWKGAAVRSRVLLTGWDGDALLSESPRFYFRTLLRRGELAELAAGWAWFIVARHTLPPMGFRMWLKRKLGRYPVHSAYPSWIDPSFESRNQLRARWAQINAEPRPPHPTRPLASTMLSVPNWWALFEGYDPGVRGFAQEARHPLIDRRLVDYILAIPPVPWSIDKHILRCSMTGTLPEAVRLRPKSPLAGDPSVQMVRDAAGHPIDDFAPTARLARYAARDAVPCIAGETNSESLWLNVRAYSLNRWLESATP